MGRNTHVRSHRFISSSKRRPKRVFNWKGFQTVANNNLVKNTEKSSLILNCALLLLPWALLFSLGAFTSPVYAQGGIDTATQFDTLVFLAGGLAVFIIALVFGIMLKGRGKK